MPVARLMMIALVGLSLRAAAEPCSVAAVEAAARTATTAFCAAQKEGCAVELRPPNKQGERTVMVSLIHSFDEHGKPRFMPEGFQFVEVSAVCRVVRIRSHAGQLFPARK